MTVDSKCRDRAQAMEGEQELPVTKTESIKLKRIGVPRKSISILLGVILAVGVFGIAFDLIAHSSIYQRDLQTYYYAGLAFAEGRDPYDIDVLSELAHTTVVHKFVYPPITLPLFQLIIGLDFNLLYYLVLVIKGIVLVGLYTLWIREFLPKVDLAFALFCLLAYNAAIYVDLRVGNISIFEELFIWFAFFFLLRDRLIFFTFFILITAIFKLTPALFLLLLLFSKDRARYVYLAGAFVSFLAIQLLSYYVAPQLFKGFIVNVVGLDERGIINPSTLAILRDGYDFLWRNSIPSAHEIVPIGLFLFVAVGIFIISLRLIQRLEKTEWPDKKKIIIFFACVIYSLVMPRFKTYSYILLLVPSYYILWMFHEAKRTTSVNLRNKYVSIAMLACLSSLHVISFGSEVVKQSVLSYSSLVAVYYVWGRYIRTLSRMIASDSRTMASTF